MDVVVKKEGEASGRINPFPVSLPYAFLLCAPDFPFLLLVPIIWARAVSRLLFVSFFLSIPYCRILN